MRKIVLILLATITVGCCGNRDAERVAYEYSMALANYNLDAAEALATEETLETMFPIARRIMATVDSSYIISDTPAEIEITSVDMTSDTSAVAHWHKTTPIKDLEGDLQLRKRDGRWLAHDVLEAPKKDVEIDSVQTVNGREIHMPPSVGLPED